MNSLPVTPEQAQAIADGQSELWVKMDPQPIDDTGAGAEEMLRVLNQTAVTRGCPYGKPGDVVRLEYYDEGMDMRWFCDGYTLTDVAVEQRDGVWGWLLKWDS